MTFWKWRKYRPQYGEMVAFWKRSGRYSDYLRYLHRVREKNGTNNILGITLTKFNKFSQLLAQFMLTCQLTKKL